MLNEAANLVTNSNFLSLNNESQTKIKKLVYEMIKIYRLEKNKYKNKVCCICGSDNFVMRNSYGNFLVNEVICGYENRKNESPVFCAKHTHGWSVSYSKWFYKTKNTTNEDVDLCLASFLINTLIKYKSKS